MPTISHASKRSTRILVFLAFLAFCFYTINTLFSNSVSHGTAHPLDFSGLHADFAHAEKYEKFQEPRHIGSRKTRVRTTAADGLALGGRQGKSLGKVYKHSRRADRVPVAQDLRNPEEVLENDVDSWWADSHARGCKLVGKMNDPDLGGVEASKFTQVSDLDKYGWTSEEDTKIPGSHLDNFKEKTGRTGPNPSSEERTDLTHDEDSAEGDTLYMRTEAVYSNSFYPEEGLIVAHHNFGPRVSAKLAYDDGEWEPPFPPLSQWSDAAFLQFKKFASSQQQTQHLGGIVRSWVVNIQSLCITFRALENLGIDDGPPEWPGVEIQMNTEEGQAILGSPNGNGVAWLLIQHKEQLGQKRVRSVIVYETKRHPNYAEEYRRLSKLNLMFIFEDVPAVPEDEDEDMIMEDVGDILGKRASKL